MSTVNSTTPRTSYEPEAEEQIESVRFFYRSDLSTRRSSTQVKKHTKMSIQFRIHNANQLLERQQLFLHAALVSQEILFLTNA